MKAILGMVLSAAVLVASPASAEPLCGDVNGSDTVSGVDALLVLKKSVGQDVALECDLCNQLGLVFLNTPGTAKWLVPDGVTSIKVTMVGGGGGGADSGPGGGAGKPGTATSFEGLADAGGGGGGFGSGGGYGGGYGGSGGTGDGSPGQQGNNGSSNTKGGASFFSGGTPNGTPGRNGAGGGGEFNGSTNGDGGGGGGVTIGRLDVTPGDSIEYTVGTGGDAAPGAFASRGGDGLIMIEY